MAGNDQNEEDRPVSDWPNMDPRWWMTAAVTVTVGLAIPGAIFAAVAVFSRQLPSEAEKMVEVLVPFGTIVLALITFLTVVWRGLLTDQQVKEQRRQNDAKDAELLAKLLVDGAGLLGDEIDVKRIAGISALHTVAVAPIERYARNAMDILLDFCERNYKTDKTSPAVRNAYNALYAAAGLGRRSNASVKFVEDTWTPNASKWILPLGAVFARVQGGWFDKESFASLDRQTTWMFTKVRFDECVIENGSWQFISSHFVGCRIAEPQLVWAFNNLFDACDFSNAVVNSDDYTSYVAQHGGLKANQNFYYDDTPPTSDKPIDWPNELICLPATMRPS